jgi:ABC-type sugar transport system permease subunit
VFCIPFLIGFFLFFLVPVIQTGIISFRDVSASPSGIVLQDVGIKHYFTLFFENASYIPKLKESFVDLTINFPCILLFSFFIAIVLNQKFKGRIMARAVFFLPVIIYSGVLAMMQTNQIQTVTMSAITAEASGQGTGIVQLNDVIAGLFSTIKLDDSLLNFVTEAVSRVQEITMASGVQILIFLAGLQNISPSLYEASSMEGATGWENFWKVTFPMISPIILVNAVYTIIDSMAGLNNPIIQMVYSESFVYGKYGSSAAMSWVYFIIISVVLLVFIGIASRKVYYEDKR